MVVSSHPWEHVDVDHGLFQYEVLNLHGVKVRLPNLKKLLVRDALSAPWFYHATTVDIFQMAPQPLSSIHLDVNPSMLILPWPQLRALHVLYSIMTCLKMLTQT